MICVVLRLQLITKWSFICKVEINTKFIAKSTMNIVYGHLYTYTICHKNSIYIIVNLYCTKNKQTKIWYM